MTQLTINHADGTAETIPETVGWERKREIGAMRRVMIDVDRAYARAVALEPKSDSIDLGTRDTLRLVDVETGGPTHRLICYSFEWDANREEFTPGGDLRTGTDADLVADLVGEVGSWTLGDTTALTGTLNFVFNHAHRHEALRRIEKNVPGELRFRDGGTVDYVDALGTDKTATVTLSTAEGNVSGEITVTNRGRELDGTHFRVLGAHEGEAQLFANLVPSDDPATYENRVGYDTARWSSGDTRDWDRWQNKDVTDQATIEEEAAALGEEITEDLVEAKTTVEGEDLSVGDWVHVTDSEADLDRDMRVHRITTRRSGAKEVDDVLLSTRTTVRQDDGADLRDIQRFNTSFQGSSVVIQGGGARQPVDATTNAEIPFDYPEIEYEHSAELHIRGLNYRHYSKPTGHSHSVTIPDHSHSVTIHAPSHTHELSNPGSDASLGKTEGPDSTTFDGHQHIYKVSTNITSFEEDTVTSDSGGGTTETTDTAAGVSPGIEETADVPGGCDVLVNGTTVATDVGTGTFETTVDISGELTRGAWNMIEVTSDSLGHVQATISIDGYKQIGAN